MSIDRPLETRLEAARKRTNIQSLVIQTLALMMAIIVGGWLLGIRKLDGFGAVMAVCGVLMLALPGIAMTANYGSMRRSHFQMAITPPQIVSRRRVRDEVPAGRSFLIGLVLISVGILIMLLGAFLS